MGCPRLRSAAAPRGRNDRRPAPGGGALKVDPRQAARVLGSPGALRAVLLHGEDAGLIRELATTAVRAAAGTLDDPFRLATLSRDAHDRLTEEMGALSLSGGRRVVWVRDATDALLASLKGALARPGDTLAVIEGPGLPSRSKLRALLESMPDGAVIACYPEEGRALEAQVERMLGAEGVRIDPDALSWFAERLGPDRAAIRGEVEKLVLYAGEAGRLGLDDVTACIGDAGGAALEEAAFAAAAGDRVAADRAIERSLAEGTSPIASARVLLSHLHRLRQVRATMEDAGLGAREAMDRLRPPVFFRRAAAFAQALSLWSMDALARAAEQTQALELACKRTGAPDGTLCRRHFATVAAQAASQAAAQARARR